MKGMCECGKPVARNGVRCKTCHEEFAYKARQVKVAIHCRRCGGEMMVTISHHKTYLKAGGGTCPMCRARISSETMTATRARETPEERTERSRRGNAMADKHKAVVEQWRAIRSDPVLYAKVCRARTEKLKAVWDGYGDEARTKRVKSFYQSFGRRMSRSSDALKQAMVDAGLYDGFVSEEVFHGFVPDEINHGLRLIVEMFGDLYHCNPKRYTDASTRIATIDRTVGEQWMRDKRRLACFRKHGYRTVVVWDSDFRNDPVREVDRIRKAIEASCARGRSCRQGCP